MPADKPMGTSRRTALTGLAAMLAAGCGRLEFMAANVPAIFGDYRRHADLPYGADPQQRLRVYVPRRVSAAPRPLVVFWHGGRWRFGDKADYRFVGAALAELGLVAVLPNYRHYPDVSHQFRAARRAADAAGAWLDGRHGAAEEFAQSGGGAARARRAGDAQAVSDAGARRHGRGHEHSGARPCPDARRHRGVRQAAAVRGSRSGGVGGRRCGHRVASAEAIGEERRQLDVFLTDESG